MISLGGVREISYNSVFALLSVLNILEEYISLDFAGSVLTKLCLVNFSLNCTSGKINSLTHSEAELELMIYNEKSES